MVSAMLQGHTAKLPQRTLDPLGQRLKRFRKTQTVHAPQEYAPAQSRPPSPVPAWLSRWLPAVAACAPAWDGTCLDVGHTRAQTRCSLAALGRARLAPPPRANLPQRGSHACARFADV